MSTQTEVGRRTAPGYDGPAAHVRHTFTETKSGFKTSEFYVMILFVAGVLVASYMVADDGFARDEGWLYATIGVVGYIVSRGLAKLATREPYEDRNR